ncbi:MAG: hypothetical protein V4617_01110 [Gemmatimonadota bacterium]
MRRLLALLAVAAVPLFWPVTDVGAQESLTPRPIDAAAPSAQRARAVADLALAGDQGKLETYLKEHAAPAYASTPTFATDVTALLDALKTGARVVARIDGLEKVGVGIALAKASGAQLERAIVVRMEPEAPHRITGLLVVPIGGGGGE